MENVNLKQTIIGGYNKKSVISCLEKIEAECNELKEKTKAEVFAVKKDYYDLDKKYQELLTENAKLQKECDNYRENKNLLAQLEIDVNVESKERMNKTHTDANDLREKYIIKAKEEMLEIKKIQVQLDELISMISQKNKTTKEQNSLLEKVIGASNATEK